MTATGPMSAYLDTIYDEAMELLIDLRDGLVEARETDMTKAAQLSFAVSDASEIFAWILIHKAVQSGEISAQDALEHPAHELPALRAEEMAAGSYAAMSKHARNLVARTRTLRQRAGRLSARLLAS